MSILPPFRKRSTKWLLLALCVVAICSVGIFNWWRGPSIDPRTVSEIQLTIPRALYYRDVDLDEMTRLDEQGLLTDYVASTSDPEAIARLLSSLKHSSRVSECRCGSCGFLTIVRDSGQINVYLRTGHRASMYDFSIEGSGRYSTNRRAFYDALSVFNVPEDLFD